MELYWKIILLRILLHVRNVAIPDTYLGLLHRESQPLSLENVCKCKLWIYSIPEAYQFIMVKSAFPTKYEIKRFLKMVQIFKEQKLVKNLLQSLLYASKWLGSSKYHSFIVEFWTYLLSWRKMKKAVASGMGTAFSLMCSSDSGRGRGPTGISGSSSSSSPPVEYTIILFKRGFFNIAGTASKEDDFSESKSSRLAYEFACHSVKGTFFLLRQNYIYKLQDWKDILLHSSGHMISLPCI